MTSTDRGSRAHSRKLRIASLGITVTPSTVDHTIDAVSRASIQVKATLIGAHNLHSVYVFHTNDQFRRFYDAADLVLIDGWPVLVAINREQARNGLPTFPAEYRIGSTDWISQAIQSPQVTRVCVIGASSSSNTQFIDRHLDGNELVEFFGYPGDPWHAGKLRGLVESVRSFKPQLTLVGMGMPLQEEVALALKTAGVTGTIATVGGAIDQLSGKQAHAPRWTGRLRIEWLWRLASDPRRLAYRYLAEPVMLFVLLLRLRKQART